jgi:hypothetical protein
MPPATLPEILRAAERGDWRMRAACLSAAGRMAARESAVWSAIGTVGATNARASAATCMRRDFAAATCAARSQTALSIAPGRYGWRRRSRLATADRRQHSTRCSQCCALQFRAERIAGGRGNPRVRRQRADI